MDPALPYLCFCYGQLCDLNDYTHIFEVFQLKGPANAT